MNGSGPRQHHHVSAGLRLARAEWGDPAAPALVLLHGSLDHARSWDAVARPLAAGWRVVAPDLRGHGDSDWSPDGAYLSSYHLLDLHRLVALLGERPVALVGHSFGGNLAARYAAAYPERVSRLALIDGFGPLPETYAAWEAARPGPRTRGWLDRVDAAAARVAAPMADVAAAAARLRQGNPALSAELAAHLARHGTRPSGDGVAWKHDPRVALFPPEDFLADGAAVWPDIRCPTLLCFGARSWNRDPAADGRADRLARRRIVRIEDAGHWPHHDRPDEVVAILSRFLRDDDPAAAGGSSGPG